MTKPITDVPEGYLSGEEIENLLRELSDGDFEKAMKKTEFGSRIIFQSDGGTPRVVDCYDLDTAITIVQMILEKCDYVTIRKNHTS